MILSVQTRKQQYSLPLHVLLFFDKIQYNWLPSQWSTEKEKRKEKKRKEKKKRKGTPSSLIFATIETTGGYQQK